MGLFLVLKYTKYFLHKWLIVEEGTQQLLWNHNFHVWYDTETWTIDSP